MDTIKTLSEITFPDQVKFSEDYNSFDVVFPTSNSLRPYLSGGFGYMTTIFEPDTDEQEITCISYEIKEFFDFETMEIRSGRDRLTVMPERITFERNAIPLLRQFGYSGIQFYRLMYWAVMECALNHIGEKSPNSGDFWNKSPDEFYALVNTPIPFYDHPEWGTKQGGIRSIQMKKSDLANKVQSWDMRGMRKARKMPEYKVTVTLEEGEGFICQLRRPMDKYEKIAYFASKEINKVDYLDRLFIEQDSYEFVKQVVAEGVVEYSDLSHDDLSCVFEITPKTSSTEINLFGLEQFILIDCWLIDLCEVDSASLKHIATYAGIDSEVLDILLAFVALPE